MKRYTPILFLLALALLTAGTWESSGFERLDGGSITVAADVDPALTVTFADVDGAFTCKRLSIMSFGDTLLVTLAIGNTAGTIDSLWLIPTESGGPAFNLDGLFDSFTIHRPYSDVDSVATYVNWYARR